MVKASVSRLAIAAKRLCTLPAQSTATPSLKFVTATFNPLPISRSLHTPASFASRTSNIPVISTRSISLSSRFRLPVLKKQASDAPDDVEKQLRLFEELMLTDAKGKDELIGRYEELTAVSTSGTIHPLLQSDEAFKLYLKALGSQVAESSESLPYLTKMMEAPSLRAALLEANSPPAVATPTPTAVSADATDAVAQPTAKLSPSALVTALFSGSRRGKGGDARVLSTGSFGTTSSVGAGEPIRVIVEEAKSPIAYRAIRFVFVTLLYGFLILSFLSLLLDSSGILRAQQTAPFTSQTPTDLTDSSGRGTTFKDVHGVEEAKLELYEIVEFLKDPSRFAKLGGKLPRGVLLTGPPGTGKTLLARAVAGEAGVAFFSASGSEFDEMYVGVGAKRIRELFAAARKAAPAIIFIDELDAIGGKRSPRDQSYVKQTLNQLLVELDGFSSGEGVILIGATNFPESLDKALIRPGRFDRHVVVPLPDVRGRFSILTHHMRNIVLDKTSIDITNLARGTIGFSGADLQALVNQAAVKASAENAESVRGSHFEWAKERIMMGAARKSAYVSEADKLATAYHEGGHALVALFTPGAYPLQSVTVVPRGQALGYTLMLPEMDKNSSSLAEYRARLSVALGGRAAEELIYGKSNVTDGASSDISSATNMATMMVTRFGFSDLIGPVAHTPDSNNMTSPTTQAVIESEIRGLIDSAQTRALNLLTEKSVELERLARALVLHETLTLAEVKQVIAGETIVKELDH